MSGDASAGHAPQPAGSPQPTGPGEPARPAPEATRVAVPLGGAAYDVHIGPGLLERLDELVAWPSRAATVAVITNATVAAVYGERVTAACQRAGLGTELIEVPDGEHAKSAETLTQVWHRLAAAELRRSDVILALGGGVVGDLAGFAAATWHRGVAVVQVPTTLLAMCDAAIGGKTGVNLPHGKNLVGAFHQPLAVVADTATLATLDARQRRAGLGEAAKYGFIADPVVLSRLEARPDDAVAGEPELLADVVARGVAVKADLVGRDEREGGDRALLNYGHTVGHAVEAASGYDVYLHGEAVALGMVAAARLGERLGISEAGLAQRTVALLDALGLPTGGVRLDPAAVRAALGRDKKAVGGGEAGWRFVLCERPGRARIVEAPSPAAVDAAIASLTAPA